MPLWHLWTKSIRAHEIHWAQAIGGEEGISATEHCSIKCFSWACPTAALPKSQEAIFFHNAEEQSAPPAKSHFYLLYCFHYNHLYLFFFCRSGWSNSSLSRFKTSKPICPSSSISPPTQTSFCFVYFKCISFKLPNMFSLWTNQLHVPFGLFSSPRLSQYLPTLLIW